MVTSANLGPTLPLFVVISSSIFVLGTSASSSGYTSDNAEIEKALGHLDTFIDKMSELFGVADVISGFNSKLAATVQVRKSTR